MIAYLCPGFLVLLGVSVYVPIVQEWLEIPAQGSIPIGGFLFVLLGSLTLGVIISGLRWATVNPVMGALGLQKPEITVAELFQRPGDEPVKILQTVNQGYYRYYQFYANILISVILTGILLAMSWRATWTEWIIASGAFAALVGILLGSAYDSLNRFYSNIEELT